MCEGKGLKPISEAQPPETMKYLIILFRVLKSHVMQD